jgi:hypothetical protein
MWFARSGRRCLSIPGVFLVPSGWLADVVLEVVGHFAAASYETYKVESHWRHGGNLYRDGLVRIVIDMPDLAKNR